MQLNKQTLNGVKRQLFTIILDMFAKWSIIVDSRLKSANFAIQKRIML